MPLVTILAREMRLNVASFFKSTKLWRCCDWRLGDVATDDIGARNAIEIF